jgi:hypothetical protein
MLQSVRTEGANMNIDEAVEEVEILGSYYGNDFNGEPTKEKRAIETVLRELDYLKERLHKADGMANEINILTRENRQQAQELDAYREMCGKADSIRFPLDDEGHYTTINRYHNNPSRSYFNKWAAPDDVSYHRETALEAFNAIQRERATVVSK